MTTCTSSPGTSSGNPRWFEADLYFDGPYEERYRFLAYGDDN